jgi:HAD superfamily hydrolase (TIGR01490 family)
MKSKSCLLFVFLANFVLTQKIFCDNFENYSFESTTTDCLSLNPTFSCLDFSNSISKDVFVDSNCKKVKKPEFKYVIFDICRCFWKKSLYDILSAYQKQKGLSLSYYLKMAKFGVSYAFGTLDPQEAYDAFLKYCKGTPLQELQKSCSYIWEHECKNCVFLQAKELFDSYKKEGATLILAESGFKELYDELCKNYKFDYCCTSMLELKDSKLSGKLVGAPCSRKEKLERVKNLIEKKLNGSLKDAIFYANSHNDIPLLEKVGKAVAVNPDSKLESYAKKKGWQILKFNRIK